MKIYPAVLVLLSVVGMSGSSRAAWKHRIAVMAAVDSWIDPQQGFHGALMAAYDLDGLVRGSHLLLEYNTDTFRISYNRLSLMDKLFEFGWLAEYEFGLAGLLGDYYQEGKKDEQRGFKASFFRTEMHIKANLPQDSYLEVALGLRNWSFKKKSQTAVMLPADAWVFEPRVRYTFWRIKNDNANIQRQRPFSRIRGVALGMELGLDVRSEVKPWGARDPDDFQPIDPRNDPAQVIFSARQWLKAGWQMHPRIRTQLTQVASVGYGEDDLTRVRIGGQNPYVVALAGAPWAAILSEKFLALENSWHFRVLGQIECGFALQALLVEDKLRLGQTDVYAPLGGLGLFADVRFGDLQIDLRAGYTPSLTEEWSRSGQFGLFAAVGWMWSSM